MNAIERRNLSKEAEMQLKALQKIKKWKNYAIAASTIGVAVTYAGLAGTSRSLFLGILGVIIILAGSGCAMILNLGIKNGKRNVEKMLAALDVKGELS